MNRISKQSYRFQMVRQTLICQSIKAALAQMSSISVNFTVKLASSLMTQASYLLLHVTARSPILMVTKANSFIAAIPLKI
jgi:hypothetical protein